jgi:multiple sugar transport system substrate-binding protein
MWEPLNKAPYNLDINDTFDYLHNVMINSEGDICGIEQSICPAGLAYRKDLAKEYFGTDDPKELEALFPTWDAFIQKGIEAGQKSKGTVYMWRGIEDAAQFVREQGAASWIEGKTVKATAALFRTIQFACTFRDAGICDKLEAWSPAWYASFGEARHIFVGCATWSVPFIIELGDPEGKDAGRWGLMNVPEGNISWGGTTLGISKTSKEKALAWTFVKWACLSTPGAETLNGAGLFTSAKKPYTENPGIVSFKSAWFGDQDLGEKYIGEIVPNIRIRPMNFDDNEVHSALNRILQRLNNDRGIDAGQAMTLLKEELEVTIPDYTIE